MSLIAESLKNALKARMREKAPAADINLLDPGLFKETPPDSRRLRIIGLIIFPAIILGLLIYAGALDKKRTSIGQLPLLDKFKTDKAPVAPAPSPPPQVREELKIESVPAGEKPKAPATDKSKEPSSAEKSQGAEALKSALQVVTGLAGKKGEEKTGVAADEKKVKTEEGKKQIDIKAKAEVIARLDQPEPVAVEKPKSVRAKKMREPIAGKPAEGRRIPKKPPPAEDGESPRGMREELAEEGAAPERERVAAAPRTPAPGPDIFRDGNYYFNRGVFYQEAGDFEKALANFRQAMDADPNNPDVHNNMGVVYKEMRAYDQAVESFHRALYISPNYARAYNNLGVVYFMKRNYDAAISNFQKAVEIQPANLEAYNNLAVAFKDQDQLENALVILNKAMSIDASHAPTNYNLGVVYEQKNDMHNAVHFYRRFVQLGLGSHARLVAQVRDHLKTLEIR